MATPKKNDMPPNKPLPQPLSLQERGVIRRLLPLSCKERGLGGEVKTLVVLAGPTAVGKTDLSVKLAKHFDTEIVSCDSRQFYKELSIGTAKPTVAEMAGVKHHFINSHSIETLYSAGAFERDALECLERILLKKNIAFMVGGSGLYIKAVCEGLDFLPETPPKLRGELMQRLENEGLEILQNELKNLDPVFCESSEFQNPQRVVRALEVCLFTKKPFSDYKVNNTEPRPFDIVQIALTREREELYERINQRVEQMLADGLIEEVKSVINFREHNALKTVGYKEVFDFLDGQTDYETMVELIKRNTRRYAKRQLTWFRHQGNFTLFEPKQFDEIVEFVGKHREK